MTNDLIYGSVLGCAWHLAEDSKSPVTGRGGLDCQGRGG